MTSNAQREGPAGRRHTSTQRTSEATARLDVAAPIGFDAAAASRLAQATGFATMKVGDILMARFELVSLAGEGGMGTVWRAHDRTHGHAVALKLMRFDSPAGALRFEREASVLASMEHPGIVRYVASGETDAGERYLAMDWLEGEDLGARLAREGLTFAEPVESYVANVPAHARTRARSHSHERCSQTARSCVRGHSRGPNVRAA